MLDHLAVGEAEPVGLRDTAGPAGRGEGLFYSSACVVEHEWLDLPSTGSGVRNYEVTIGDDLFDVPAHVGESAA
jgi:hypothetical protein